MIRRLLALALLVCALVATAGPANAECKKFEVLPDGTVKCVDWGDTGNPGGDPDDPVWTDPNPGPYYVYQYIPVCDSYESPAMCAPDLADCEWASDIVRVYRQLVRPPDYTKSDDPDDWENTGLQCLSPEDRTEGGPPTITRWMVIEAARENVPSTVVTVEPAARTYVRIPTNFSVSGGTTTVTVTLIGTPVTISYTPQTVTWSFGDGATGSGPGIPDAAVGEPGAVEHPYLRRGSYSVTATQAFQVSASLPNGTTLTLDEPISGTSEPYPLDVGEIQSLVTEVW